MTIDVDPDWWKTLFDEVYLLTDARSVDNAELTRREIAFFSEVLPLQPGDRILDLCGGHGRHALELCRRGFSRCTVLDYSQSLLDIGQKRAAAEGHPLRFFQGDARNTTLDSSAFDHVLILGNSLGYLTDADADLQILVECRRLLSPGGWLLLDVSDGAVADTRMASQAWHEIGDDVVVCRQRELKAGRVRAREMVLSKQRGLIRDRNYGIRLYNAEDLITLATRAGFGDVHLHTDASVLNSKEDVGCMNHRLVLVARKP